MEYSFKGDIPNPDDFPSYRILDFIDIMVSNITNQPSPLYTRSYLIELDTLYLSNIDVRGHGLI